MIRENQTIVRKRSGAGTSFFAAFVFGMVLSFTSYSSFAQLQRYSLPKQPSVSVHKGAHNARTQDTGPLHLPFFDDFSSTVYDYPDTARWVQSHSVNVNNGNGINEPSINVATLDGLDSTYSAYNAVDVLANQITDQLLSKPIDLSTITPAEKETLFLSFFYQAGGNGEAPDKNDHLLLEFKSSALDVNGKNIWNTILTIYPLDNFDPNVFYDTMVNINDKLYLFDSFQFRFRRYGRESGPFDAWNLDYIYLDKGRSAGQVSYPDRAIASGLSPLFGRYNAVPLKHFYKDTLFSDVVNFDTKNLKANATEQDVTLTSAVSIKNYNKGSSAPVVTSKVLTGDVNDFFGVLQAYERAKSKITLLPDLSDGSLFNADSLITINLKVKIISGDQTDSDKGNFVDATVNDTISAVYTIKDYYAYDDGTAEYSAGLTQSGNLGAYLFEMQDTATLSSFDIYFPDFAVSNNEALDFNIYDDNNGMPGKSLYAIASRAITAQGLNKFTHILMEPVAVPKKFYIGWSQPLSGSPKIGLDTSNDTGDKFFAKVNGFWTPNFKVHGSLMIRPVFGKGVLGPVNAVTDPEKPGLALYPNPSNGAFFIKGHYDQIQILSITGQSIPFQTEDWNDEKKITMSSSAAGLYLVQLRSGAASETKKIIIR